MATGLSLGHRDRRAIARRAGSIAARFGPTPARLMRRLELLDEATSDYGCRPTFPITASVLARHPKAIRPFAERGFEFALHGLVHNDHGRLSYEEQRVSLARAGQLFERSGIPYCGFRGPYLRHNPETERAVRDLGLSYHSSQAVVYRGAAERLSSTQADLYERILRMYAARDAAASPVRPALRDGLVDIPVAVPDDEIMIERLGYDDEQQTAAWLSMLDHTCERNELLTLQLHPERANECEGALRAVLASARRRTPPVWVATLQAIAAWWRERAEARLHCEWSGPGAAVVTLSGSDRCRLELAGVAASPRESAAQRLEIRTDTLPLISAGPGADPARLAFLREEGFALAESTGSADAALRVEASGEQGELDMLEQVAGSRAPLVRIARWPDGCQAALAITGDIDSITLQDFAIRLWEAR